MKTRLHISCLLMLMCIWPALSGQESDSLNFSNLEPYDFHLRWLREEKSLLLDVREPFEFRKNRIDGALNAPSAEALSAITDTLAKETCLFVYCTTGFRSKKAASTLCKKGFTNVFNLAGGIVAWKKEDFPVDRKRRKTDK